MTRLRPSVAVGAAVVALAAAGCGSAVMTATDRSTPTVQIGPADLELAVTYRITPSRSLVLWSQDDAQPAGTRPTAGVLTLRINATSVARDTTLTIARVGADQTPKGVIGSAYFLSPEVTRLEKPMRISLEVGELPAGVEIANLRLARLDTGERYYQPTPGQAIIDAPDLRFIGGETDTFGVYAVVDTAQVTVHTDVAPTEEWRGLHLLDIGRVALAEEAFANAVGRAPTPQATFGWALTRLLSLPALPSLQHFFASCGQPVWDDALIFGDRGYFAEDLERGRGTADLEVGQGFDAANVLMRTMTPALTVAELGDAGLCLDPEAGLTLPKGYLSVHAVDPNIDGDGTTVDLTIVFDPAKPRTDSADSLATLRAAAADGVVELPLEVLNGRVEVQRGAVTTDSTKAPVSGSTGTKTQTVGLFYPSPVSPGVLRLRDPGAAVGDDLQVELADVRLSPQWLTSRPEIMVLNGALQTRVSTPPSLDDLPLMQEEGSLAATIASCDPALIPALDEAFLLGIVAEAASELEAVAGLFKEAVAGDDGADFRFDVPLGLLQRPGVVRFGPTETHLVAAVLEVGAAALRLVEGYHLFDGDLRDAVTDGTSRTETCPDPCHPTTGCTDSLTPTKVLDARLMTLALNARLLSRDPGAPDLTGVQTLLLAVVDDLEAVLLGNSFDTVLNFQNDSIRGGTAALLTTLAQVRAGLVTTSYLDGAMIGVAENMFAFLGGFFTTPPTASDLRLAAETTPADPLCLTELAADMICTDGVPPTSWPTSTQVYCNLSPPTYASGAPYCRGTLSPSLAELCSSAAVSDFSTTIAGWTLTGLMNLYSKSSSNLSCDDPAGCGANTGGTCPAGTCVFPESSVDMSAIEAMLPTEGRAEFILWRNVGEVEAALGLKL
ncbi:MAG: hypothetical protein HY903_23985 [Deltaproteobacteria bacterium]|nr:hypothetical protein [Deltaproteobacteria bacterium]